MAKIPKNQELERVEADAKRGSAKSAPVPDDFTTFTERAYNASRPYLKAILIGAVALVAVIVGWTVWTGMQEKKAGAATMELGKVLDTSTARVEEGGPDMEAIQQGIDPGAARFKTYKDRSDAEILAVQALEASYGGTQVARPATLIQAGALYDLGKYDEALAAYRKLVDGGADREVVAMAREGIGYVLEAKALAQTDAAARTAGLDEALKAYGDITSDDKEPRYPTVLYHQARIQALKGQKQAAIDLYKKVLEKSPGPTLTEEVQGRLALLDPNPAPPPAAPAAPVVVPATPPPAAK